MNLMQGDIVTIDGFCNKFLVVSKNAFIRATGVFHVCPIIVDVEEGPLHIFVAGRMGTIGVAMCEHLKMIDPEARACSRVDSILYSDIMNVSDAIQGMFEYD